MIIIDADKFLSYLIFSKHIDGLTCGEVKEAIEMCKVDVIDKIRTEVAVIPTHEQIDEHTALIRTGDQVKQVVLKIIDKYRVESEVEERFDHEGNEIKPHFSCANCKHLDEWVPINKNCPCQYCNRKLLNKWEAKEV